MTIEAIVERRYVTEDRLTIDVTVHRGKELVYSTFALNEASVEKAARERMLEVVVEIDDRPLSRWGCDGVVCATPTGSTAYNFSAGGPVVWPGVEALLMVPISAHALFARPMVVAPTSVLAVEVLANTEGSGRAVVRRSTHGRPAARGADRGTPRRPSGSAGPPAPGALHRPPGRQVRPARGGLARRLRASTPRGEVSPMLEEIRIRSLGVIESSTLELGPGLTVITGETGAGKTMVVTALGLLLGGRADPGAVRTGAKNARVEGVLGVDDLPDVVAAVEEAGGEVEDGRVVLARNVAAEGRSRAWVGGAAVPVSALAAVAEPLVAVHGQSDQHRLLKQSAQRDALDRFGGPSLAKAAAAYTDLYSRLVDVERELRDVVLSAQERAREADQLQVRPRRDRGRHPGAGRGHGPGCRGRPARLRRHAAHRGRTGPRGVEQRAGQPGRAGDDLERAHPARGRSRARPAGRRARRPAGRGDLPALRRRGRRRVVRRQARHRPRPPRRGQ